MAILPVLLVEDNPNDTDLMLRELAHANLLNPVIVAVDGRAALAHLKAGRFCVVLLDLALPDMDGLDVLRAIRADAQTRLTPVVVLTAMPEQEHMIASYQFGANSFVRKPLAFGAFAAAVRQLGLYWTLINEIPE